MGRWNSAAWNRPFSLDGDALEIYARVQAASEDPWQPLQGYAEVSRLGAPFSADWTRYPVSDRLVFTIIGLLARALNEFVAINLAVVALHVLNALGFYVCARFLRWRVAWAFAFALLFSFCSYNFRWGVTVSFSQTFALPPLLLLCGWVGRDAPAVRSRGWNWLALGLGAWLGGANPYLAFFAGQLAGFATLLQWLRIRDSARLRAGTLFLGMLVGSFVLHNASYFIADATGAGRLTLSRNYAGTEIYAMKLTDLVIPPASHAVPLLADLGRLYRARSAFRAEFFAPYLGVVGICGLAGLFWFGFRWMVAKGRRRRPLPDGILGVGWTLLFSSAGGVNSLLALAGLDMFRASGRYSIFILLWSFFFAGRWLQRRSQHVGRPWVVAMATSIAVLGVIDSLPMQRIGAVMPYDSSLIENHRALIAAMKERTGPEPRIFQLPTTRFPEAGEVVKMGDYEHLLPYLVSKTVQISYGNLRHTPTSRAIRTVGQLPPERMKEVLEEAGFHAIWINRRGFADNGDSLIASLRTLGLQELSQKFVPHIFIFLLRPASSPHPFDPSHPEFYPRWDPTAKRTTPAIRAVKDWDDIEREPNRSWRWARKSGTVGIWMRRAGTVRLSFLAATRSTGNLTLELAGRKVWSMPEKARLRFEPGLELPLRAGWHQLTWRFDGRLRPAGGTDGRLLGFSIENLALTVVDAVQTPAGPDPPENPVPYQQRR
jgi:phosphoglycerol transferase